LKTGTTGTLLSAEMQLLDTHQNFMLVDNAEPTKIKIYFSSTGEHFRGLPGLQPNLHLTFSDYQEFSKLQFCGNLQLPKNLNKLFPCNELVEFTLSTIIFTTIQ
jgi:hypothetical protein